MGGYDKVNGVAHPNWGTNWVDYRTDELNRIQYIWESTIAVTPPVGTGSLGQSTYSAFTIGNSAWWGTGYVVAPNSGNTNATMDLRDVTSSGTFHFAIRTNCTKDIEVVLSGSTVNSTQTSGKIVLNTVNLPLSKRDKTQWVEFNIPMSQLMTNAVVSTNNLNFSTPFGGQKNYLSFISVGDNNDNGNFIAWDNVYITTDVNPDTQAPTIPTGLINTTPTTNSFSLIWSPSTDNEGVIGYDVYKNDVFFGSTTTTNLTINNLTANMAYSMTVVAKDASGNRSVASLPLVVTTAKLESEPPTVPTGLINTTPTTSAFTLVWTESTDNVGVTGYDVFKDGVFYGSTTYTFLAIAIKC